MGSLTRTVSPFHATALSAVPSTDRVTLTLPSVRDTLGAVTRTLTRNPAFAVAPSIDGTSNSYVDTSVAPGQSYTYQYYVTDARGISSAVQASSATVPNSQTNPSIKWNPGHYVMAPSYNTHNPAHITEIGEMPNIKGWSCLIYWGAIETSRGVYNWNYLDGLLDQLEAVNRQLIVGISSHSFGGTTNNGIVPQYLATEPNGGGGWFVKPGGGIESKVWHASIMDRLLALFDAIGTRYNSHPNFEGLRGSESSITSPLSAPDYNQTLYVNQYKRLIQNIRRNLPNTNCWAGLNFGIPQATMPEICQLMEANKVGLYSPDVMTDSEGNKAWGDKALSGLIYNGSAWVSGGVDRRLRIPTYHDVQGPELGGKEGGFTLTQMDNFSRDQVKDHHLAWLRKTFIFDTHPDPDYMWDTTPEISPSIKTYLNGTPNTLNLGCPTSYGGVCVPRGST